MSTDDPGTLRALVDAASNDDDLARVLPRLDVMIADMPQRLESLALRARVLMQLRRYGSALDDMDRVLSLAPEDDATRFQRAVTLFGQERLGEALEDFLLLSRRRPGTVEPWANAGVILLRMERFAEALPLLREAVRLRPGQAPLRRSLANALYGAGAVDEALQQYESVVRATPGDPAALTDYAMALLGIGKPREGHALLLAALRIDPADQTALAGIYLSANELGLQDMVDRLVDYPRLLGLGERPHDAYFDRDDLRRAVLAHPGLVWQPAGRSTHQGRQSPMLDLAPGSPFAAFGRFVESIVREQMARLGNDPELGSHPWARTLPRRWRIQAWCTVLESGGRQTPHIHPAGRLSGVYYLDTGDVCGEGAGTLVFGAAPVGVTPSAPPRTHSIVPRNDLVCCFPSYFFHHTEPFQGKGAPRISLAFDVLPEG